MLITAIAAMAHPSRIIGDGLDIPFRHPEDMKFFRRTTVGGQLIVGRRTFLTLAPSFLASAGRRLIVMTRGNREGLPEHLPHVTYVRNAGAALEEARREPHMPVFVIGGAEVYKVMLPHCSRVLLTCVEKAELTVGDTYMPEFESEFLEVGSFALADNWRTRVYTRCAS